MLLRVCLVLQIGVAKLELSKHGLSIDFLSLVELVLALRLVLSPHINIIVDVAILTV